MEKTFFGKLAIWVWVVMLIVVTIVIFPWSTMNWGKVQFMPTRIITVSGTSTGKTDNQIATFTVGFTTVNDNRETAVNEVNKKMDEVVKMAKDFGIKSEDIQTVSANIYQNQDSYYDQTTQKNQTRPGSWSVSNSVQIILRDVARATALSDILYSKSGANNIYGPNFGLDPSDSKSGDKLYEAAIKDATTKAEAMAKSAGATLGKVITIQDGGAYSSPVYPMMSMMSGGGAGGGGQTSVVEPGSTTIVRTVTVSFALE